MGVKLYITCKFQIYQGSKNDTTAIRRSIPTNELIPRFFQSTGIILYNNRSIGFILVSVNRCFTCGISIPIVHNKVGLFLCPPGEQNNILVDISYFVTTHIYITQSIWLRIPFAENKSIFYQAIYIALYCNIITGFIRRWIKWYFTSSTSIIIIGNSKCGRLIPFCIQMHIFSSE